jgi:MraZ protein
MVLNGNEMVFFGEYTVSITEGGRIVVPKKIRENLKGDVFILTKGFDICLAGYDKEDWLKRTHDLTQVSILEKQDIEKKRFIFSGANEIAIDEQGRFVIPKALLEFLILSGDGLKIIGVGDHFEIWDIKKWEDYLKTLKKI